MLSVIKDEKPSPPVVSRILAVAHTCMYDAWSTLDGVAVGVHFNQQGAHRLASVHRTEANKIWSISQAAHVCAVHLLPMGKPAFDRLLDEVSTPGEGHALIQEAAQAAARAVLSAREGDGANADGKLECKPASAVKPYCDYTGYQPKNPGSLPIEAVAPNYWQPLPNGKDYQVGLAPHWGAVRPFAEADAQDYLKAFPIPKSRFSKRYGTAAYRQQVEESLRESRSLGWERSGERKAIVEYWADGPFSYLPPGHFGELAHFVVQRDRMNVDQAVKLFFVLHNASFDAGIVIWHLKYAHDYVRPITSVRFVKRGTRIYAWGGPDTPWDEQRDPISGKPNGYNRWLNGENWLPYNPTNNPNHPLTPAFPEYPSGHSGFSAASAQALKMFTGSAYFGYQAEYDPYAPAWQATLVESPELIGRHRWLYPSYVSAANQAGWSRRYGGIHFEDGDLVARMLGKQIGHRVWEKALYYFRGGDANTACRRLRRCPVADRISDGSPRWVSVK